MDINYSEAAEILKNSDDILLMCHKNPDGDTIGSAYGLYHALKSVGKRVAVVCNDPFPKDLAAFIGEESVLDFEPKIKIAVDVANSTLLGDNTLAKFGSDIDMCIDHHMSNVKYAGKTLLEGRAAAAEVVFKLLKLMDIPVKGDIANCLYMGMATDTGCFMYPNADGDTFRNAAELIDLGAEKDRINKVIFSTKSKNRVNFEAAVMLGLEYYFDGKCAVATLKRELMDKYEVDASAIGGIAGLPRQVEGVRLAVTLREEPDGSIKVSTRTEAPVDANAICGAFGGGGHARAAGASFKDCDIEEAKRRILAEAEKYL